MTPDTPVDCPGPPDARDTVLEVRDLRVRFDNPEGQVHPVDGVSFSLSRGHNLAIVGESGCGKTLTAQAIVRLLPAGGTVAGGSIVLRPRQGTPIDIMSLRSDRDPSLYRVRGGLVGMVFQEPASALSPVHTVGEQIAEAVRLHHRISRPAARRRAIDLLGRVGIPSPGHCVDRYPHELSGGMRQRAIFAIAIAGDPEVLIADEPTTALDVTLQAQILDLIRRLKIEMGCSVVLITHNMGLVAQMADEVAVMYLGRVVEHGLVDRVLRAPRHPYTIGLMRSIPHPETRQPRLPSIPGSVPSLRQIPPGCPFHPRCPWAAPGLCDQGDRPGLHGFRRRWVACHRAETIAAELEGTI